jgi:hypothetical protein
LTPLLVNDLQVLYPDTESKPPKAQRVIAYEESDADIFKTQVEAVEKAYPDVDEVMENTGFFTSEETRHDVRVKDFPDDDGVLMEFMATTTVPFDLHVTGNALWRFMSEVAIKRHCYFEKVPCLLASVPLRNSVRGFANALSCSLLCLYATL